MTKPNVDIGAYELRPEDLTAPCSIEELNFETTETLAPLQGMIGQERAREAMEFGLSVKRRGYNLYVSGNWGTRRNSYVRLLTEEHSRNLPVPKDWLYVNNFKDPHAPMVLCFEAGKGKAFAQMFTRTISFLRKELNTVFSSKDYENNKLMLHKEYSGKVDKILEKLNEVGGKYGFAFNQTEKGLVTIPLKDGKPMNEEEYKAMDSDTYEELKENSNKLNIETVDLFNSLRDAEQEYRDMRAELDGKTTRQVVTYHLKNIQKRFQNQEDLKLYLEAVIEDIAENVDRFRGQQEQPQQNPFAMLQSRNVEGFFDRYAVNLFMDNTSKKHAPVVFASNPTYYNLMGQIEYKNELGVMKTDFTMIKPGALHEANGGYLIVLAKDILMSGWAWKSLKRALLDEQLQIESLGSLSGTMVSATLKPEPIPLDVKVIVIGDPGTYQLLYSRDEEFRKLFKIMADFDMTLNRDSETVEKIARFISSHVQKDGLKHFSKEAIARIVEFSSREADDKNKLSAHLTTLVDVLYEADTWATHDGAEWVQAIHVDKALDASEKRSNKIQQRVLELFESQDYLIDVQGEKIGEINGLAVMGSGMHRFGKPSKITVSTYKGRAGIVNIEREARTSGAIHDKGVMILTGYLGQKFAQKMPLTLTAQVVFEQLYSGVDGDSASSTELYAILSSLSGIPINQSLAVTGSVNQRGEIQPIGGVNEKIEGFFKVCQIKGFTGNQGVVIPHQNKKNLMLSREVIEAVEKGKFHIYAVETIDEGIEILMGIPAGKRTRNGHFESGSLYNLVEKRLKALAEPVQKEKKTTKEK